jgi:predicted YcjX-like family ATPase
VPHPFSDLIEQARLAGRALVEYGEALVTPTVRLGITGLSRAGKTVFITALVHSLVRNGRYPVFEALSEGRIAGARLSPQPDDAVPRFDYEHHIAALAADRVWPESTRQISELRLVIEFQSRSGAMRELVLDMVDYPGEWLLDLPLLGKSFETWSAESLALSRKEPRARLAASWHAYLAGLDAAGPADESAAIAAARLFTDYLVACRDERYALSLLPPGRFLMPGELAGSPALTFAPLDLPGEGEGEGAAGADAQGGEARSDEARTGPAPAGSLWAMMRRRFEAYKEAAVRPFFRDHFARLDRQIVLIDALAAFNAGPEAVHDLEGTLKVLLDCFAIGRKTFLSSLFRPRADRILFAATKADHLHHTSHDRLEAILRRMVERAIARADVAGAAVDVIALAAVRATREAEVRRGGGGGGAGGGDALPCILGVPAAGEHAGGQTFDGKTEVAVFPGDLPADPNDVFAENAAPFRGLAGAGGAADADFRFVRFRPPPLEMGRDGAPALPHIRLDRALQFLIGDRL